MAMLLKDAKGKPERYRITPVVAEAHDGFEDVTAMRTYVSGDRTCPCPCKLSLSSADAAAVLSEIRAEVAKAVPDGATLANAKYEAEFWVGKGHDAIEAEAFAYPTLNYAADGPVPAGESRICVKWTPSPAVKSALLAAAKA